MKQINYDAVRNSCIKFFKVIPEDMVSVSDIKNLKAPSAQLARGFLIVREDGATCTVGRDIFNIVDNLCGRHIEAFNQTFHKSFATVANMSPFEYYCQQALHYLSTYGAEAEGIEVPTYIPNEALDLDAAFAGSLDFDKITIIKIVSREKAVDKIKNLFATVEKSNKDFLEAADDLYLYAGMVANDLPSIRSFELMTLICARLDLCPNNPQLALRYLVYAIAGDTLLIKNKALIDKINRNMRQIWRDKRAFEILSQLPIETWATIFFRYKPIFLAFKNGADKSCNTIINKIRRAAVVYHKPLPENSIRDIVNILKRNDITKMIEIFSNTSNRNLVKILNYFSAQLEKAPKVYNIRNGKIHIECDKNTTLDNSHILMGIRGAMTVLKTRLFPIMENKIFYIPNYISYAAPVSEKQYSGNYPWGTSVNCPEEGGFIAGIHWTNNSQRVDLDLHCHTPNMNYGWNSGYRGNGVIYTGDQTDAPEPNGAAEAFWINADNIHTPICFDFSVYRALGKVDYQFCIEAAEKGVESRGNFIFSNPIFTPIPFSTEAQGTTTLGFISDRVFYIYGGQLNNRRIPTSNYATFLVGIENKVTAMVPLDVILEESGAIIIDNLDDAPKDAEVINLSPEAINSMTLLNIIDGNLEALS